MATVGVRLILSPKQNSLSVSSLRPVQIDFCVDSAPFDPVVVARDIYYIFQLPISVTLV